MLKLNTVLTALAVVLMTLLGFLGHAIWDDVATIKAISLTTSTKQDAMARQIDDHENRLRAMDHDVSTVREDVTILQQQQQREDRMARSPKMNENNKP